MAWTAPKTFNTGDVLPASDLNTHLRDNLVFLLDQGGDLTSAATITPTTQFHKVTGTTNITAITALAAGARIVLWFPSAGCKVSSGSTIKLAAGDFVSGADTTLTLISDGTNWIEVGRSVGGGLSKIFDTTLGADAATIDFQNIPATFAHLIVVGSVRGANSTATVNQQCRVNNDSGSNYIGKYAATNSGTGTTIATVEVVTGNTIAANVFSGFHTVFDDYANTARHKPFVGTCYGLGGDGSSGTHFNLSDHGWIWKSTSAINRLTYLMSAGNMLSGCRITVYGMG